ncbi:3-dehydro-bile acid delta(4,6)-reductase [Neolewinella maritima]|uniref:3-dehydro-bile acid delta(4,6)-reductase n=1 Tax=Neolewinella maritima TaxID=1383882 RepID=A0ABN8F094_9BACT|nr:NAD(P)/FAD-dependent oxidoreductase [Neolewinella maritima]CAH0999245.1 3-dehydro-bile acid delta(4,6)-reductase [Neolewinella maritima]
MRTIVIGGGAAGFFAAIALAERHPQQEVLLLERGKSVLEKVRISGGGRCNVTHACWDPADLVEHYPRGGRELLGPFHKFACGDTMAWFEDRGVALKIEDDGRVFPTSDRSQSIIDCLWHEAKRLNVRVQTGAGVRHITAPAPPTDGVATGWTVGVDGQQYHADRLVVTTGSNPRVWKLLAAIGHTIVAPVPSLFALTIDAPQLTSLAGISLPWARLQVVGDKLQAEGPLLITHKGLSGPAVLRLSAWGARDLHPRKYDFELSVNWTARREQDVREELGRLRDELARKQVGTRSGVDLPQRLWHYLLTEAGLDIRTQWAQLGNTALDRLATSLTDSRYRVRGKATNKDEFTTAGGVDLQEVDFRTFRSRLHTTLYLAGEVLDIDAITGGFNFQAAWTGGYLIGQSQPPGAV